jgi:hypothetical protein
MSYYCGAAGVTVVIVSFLFVIDGVGVLWVETQGYNNNSKEL